MTSQSDSIQPSSHLHPISQLLKDAWNLGLKKCIPFIILGIIFTAMSIGATIVLGAIAAAVFLPGFLAPAHSGWVYTNIPAAILTGLIFFLLFVLVNVVIGAMSASAQILLVADTSTESKFKYYISHSWRFVMPMSIALTIVSLLEFGGLFLFIFPACIIAFHLIFVTYIIVLENRSPMDAVHRSVALVSQHRGETFIRLVTLAVLHISVVYMVPAILGAGKGEKGAIPFVFPFISYLMGVYSIAFIYSLYKDLSRIYDSKKVVSLTWMYAVSLIGYIVMVVGIGIGISQVTSHSSQMYNTIKMMIEHNAMRTDDIAPPSILYRPKPMPLNRDFNP